MSTSKNSPRIVLACRNPGTKLTNNLPSLAFFLRDTLIWLWFIFSLPLRVAVQRSNLRRLLHTVEELSDLGPELTAGREFAQTARVMLSPLIEAAAAGEGSLFVFSDRPALLTSF